MRNREQRRFTISELKKFDGKEGRPAYIAFHGKIYDVSGSVLWTGGTHADRHSAGDDLTERVIDAPHGEEVFMKFRVVAKLSPGVNYRQKLVERLEGLHLHPVLVHFSIAYSLLVPLLSVLHVFSGEVSFETASYYVLILGFLAAPFAGLSGLFSWKVTYEGRMTKIFARKIMFTVLLIVVITMCFGWRTLNPDVLMAKTDLSYIYLTLVASLVPIATILGYYGGRIVFG